MEEQPYFNKQTSKYKELAPSSEQYLSTEIRTHRANSPYIRNRKMSAIQLYTPLDGTPYLIYYCDGRYRVATQTYSTSENKWVIRHSRAIFSYEQLPLAVPRTINHPRRTDAREPIMFCELFHLSNEFASNTPQLMFARWGPILRQLLMT